MKNITDYLAFCIGLIVCCPAYSFDNNMLPSLGSDNETQGNTANLPKKDPAQDEQSTGEKLAAMAQEEAQQSFRNLTPEGMKSELYQYGKGALTGAVQSQVDSLLSPYGHVETDINLDDNGNLGGSSLNYLFPWYEDVNNISFSQFSVHNKDGRTIANMGVGIRHNYSQEWMFGVNTFYDSDLTRGHKRLGLGTEAWTNYLKLSGNYYLPLTSWKNSPDLDDYEERPARGWDLRLQTYLPTYPQLGSSLVYEKYYGSQVALFSTDDLQEDPSSVTLGIDYTPVPLVTLQAGYKTDASQRSEVTVNLGIDYRINVPLSKQLDASEVAQMRTLAGSRMDFVDRNNDIVLEYREKNNLDIGLFLAPTNTATACILADQPDSAEAYEGCHWTLNADITSHLKIKNVHWVPMGNFSAEATLGLPALSATNNVTAGKDNHWTLTFPAWVDSASSDANRYRLAVALEDEKGHLRQSNVVSILVAQAPVKYQLVIVDTDGEKKAIQVPADGVTPVNLKSSGAKVSGLNGETTPLAPDAQEVAFRAWEMKDKSHGREVPLHNSKSECDGKNACLFFVSPSNQGEAVIASTQSGIYTVTATPKDKSTQQTNPVLIHFSDSQPYLVTAIVDTAAPASNLIALKANSLSLGHRYRFLIAWDSNKNGVWDASDRQTVSETDLRPLNQLIHYKWVFSGHSANGTAGGYAASSTDNQELPIPETNAQAAAVLPNAGADGVQGYELKVEYQLTSEGRQVTGNSLSNQ